MHIPLDQPSSELRNERTRLWEIHTCHSFSHSLDLKSLYSSTWFKTLPLEGFVTYQAILGNISGETAHQSPVVWRWIPVKTKDSGDCWGGDRWTKNMKLDLALPLLSGGSKYPPRSSPKSWLSILVSKCRQWEKSHKSVLWISCSLRDKIDPTDGYWLPSKTRCHHFPPLVLMESELLNTV